MIHAYKCRTAGYRNVAFWYVSTSCPKVADARIKCFSTFCFNRMHMVAPHEVCAALPESPELILQSVGWSEAYLYWNEIAQGIVIDVSDTCRKQRGMSRCKFEIFGGEGTWYDEIMMGREDFQNISHFVCRVAQMVCTKLAHTNHKFVITVISEWGKHRSRLHIQNAACWIRWQLQTTHKIAMKFTVQHLSDVNRLLELHVYREAINNGAPDPLAAAKNAGHRTKRITWRDLQVEMVKVLATGYFLRLNGNARGEDCEQLLTSLGTCLQFK